VAYVGSGTSFSVSGLTTETTYYVFVFDYNNGGACSLVYNTTSPLSGNVTPSVYCASTGNTTFNTSVTNVTLNTINNTTTKTSGYSNYTAISTSLQKGVSYPLSTSLNTDGNKTVFVFAWIDFNRDGDFVDVGEAFDLGSATNVASGLTSSSPLSIAVPLTATTGTTKIRVMATIDSDASPCLSGFDGEVEDYTINITAACTPTHTVTGFAPTSGPTATDVTITGTGFSATSTVAFNGISATVVFVNSTTLIATVPNGVTTGNVTVTQGGCAFASGVFTQITTSGACAIGNSLSDLIISEVYDSLVGNSWYMELYNPTSNPINLDAAGANYKLVRYGDIGTTNGKRTIDITGTIAPGGIYVADLGSDSTCAPIFNFISKSNGINENDEIRLTKNDVTVDIVHCPNEKGYTITRNVGAVGPVAIFSAGDWNTNLNESCADLGNVPFGFTNNMPTVNTNPVDVTACGASANFNITATASSGPLTYQWYYNNGVSAGWTTVTTLAGLTISGETSNTLNLSGSIVSYGGYQFYCQVTENGTCSVASDAAQLSITATTWNGAAWSNGTPDATKLAIINGNFTTSTAGHGNINACSLVVNSPFVATVTDGMYFNIENDVTVNVGAALNIQNNGSLVQVNDTGVNTGNIAMERIANIDSRDYVYWSTPVAPFSAANISTTSNNWNLYKWIPTVPGNGAGNFGNWVSGNEIMTKGLGYIERGLNSAPLNAPVNFTATFNGVPNNGNIAVGISRGTYNIVGTYPSPNSPTNATQDDDNWNLLGNPYPSAISARAFLLANSANLDGFVKVWRHGIAPSTSASDPFYNNYGYNYDASDYLTYNLSGAATQSGFDGYIGAGQGFITKMLPGSPTASSTAVFNNSMRSNTYRNDQFYKTTNSNPEGRIWIDLVSATTANSILVAYVDGATNQKDQMYDAQANLKSNFNIYSLLDGYDRQTIQGRALPFDQNDEVPLGIKVPTNGEYAIAIQGVDGLFTAPTQNIYLEDKLLNVIHNLRSMPYHFTAIAGEDVQRFVLRYTNGTLGNEDFDVAENSVKIYPSGNTIQINSELENIQSYAVYNVLGQILATKNKVNANQSVESSIMKNNQALIVKVTLENGQTVTKKIIF
jgi:hypothetical protein